MPEFTVVIEGESASIENAAELVVLLEVLHGDQYQEALGQLGAGLAEILREPHGLFAVLKPLSPKSQVYLLEQLGPGLLEIIQRAEVLRNILAGLASPKVERRLIQLLGREGLRKLIHKPEDLAGILEWVFGRCDGFVISLLEDRFLRQLLQTGQKISVVLPAMTEASQSVLMEKLGWDHVASLAYDAHVFCLLLRSLTPELGLRLIHTFTPEQLDAAVGGEHRRLELRKYANEAQLEVLNAQLENCHAQ